MIVRHSAMVAEKLRITNLSSLSKVGHRHEGLMKTEEEAAWGTKEQLHPTRRTWIPVCLQTRFKFSIRHGTHASDVFMQHMYANNVSLTHQLS